VLNYRSYPKNKTGYPFFWTTLYLHFKKFEKTKQKTEVQTNFQLA